MIFKKQNGVLYVASHDLHGTNTEQNEFLLMFLIVVQHVKQFGSFLLRLLLTRTTIMLSNVVGPAEHITLCGHPVVFMAGSVYGQAQVSHTFS